MQIFSNSIGEPPARRVFAIGGPPILVSEAVESSIYFLEFINTTICYCKRKTLLLYLLYWQ